MKSKELDSFNVSRGYLPYVSPSASILKLRGQMSLLEAFSLELDIDDFEDGEEL